MTRWIAVDVCYNPSARGNCLIFRSLGGRDAFCCRRNLFFRLFHSPSLIFRESIKIKQHKHVGIEALGMTCIANEQNEAAGARSFSHSTSSWSTSRGWHKRQIVMRVTWRFEPKTQGNLKFYRSPHGSSRLQPRTARWEVEKFLSFFSRDGDGCELISSCSLVCARREGKAEENFFRSSDLRFTDNTSIKVEQEEERGAPFYHRLSCSQENQRAQNSTQLFLFPLATLFYSTLNEVKGSRLANPQQIRAKAKVSLILPLL